MKVKLEGVEYEIDIQRAKKMGLCKEVIPEVTSFEVGDIFQSEISSPVLISQSSWGGSGFGTYNFAGLEGLALYSTHGEGISKEKMIRYLNNHMYKFIKNINKEVHTLIHGK